jgi:hypothetical protein
MSLIQEPVLSFQLKALQHEVVCKDALHKARNLEAQVSFTFHPAIHRQSPLKWLSLRCSRTHTTLHILFHGIALSSDTESENE